jgi:hypothetical protein
MTSLQERKPPPPLFVSVYLVSKGKLSNKEFEEFDLGALKSGWRLGRGDLRREKPSGGRHLGFPAPPEDLRATPFEGAGLHHPQHPCDQ